MILNANKRIIDEDDRGSEAVTRSSCYSRPRRSGISKRAAMLANGRNHRNSNSDRRPVFKPREA